MTAPEPCSTLPPARLERSEIDCLFDALGLMGYQVIGPTVRDGAILYDQISQSADLPIGWSDAQEAGQYRLVKREDELLFGYAVGPWSWKQHLFPPRERLWQAGKTANGFELIPETVDQAPMAFLGVRACELNAIAIQDRIFLNDAYVETGYSARRSNLFLVAVNCGQPGGTCFCESMGTGPRALSGYDIAMTEVLEGADHFFILEPGSGKGEELIRKLPHRPATEREIAKAQAVTETAKTQMGRKLDTQDLKERLYQSMEHPQWEQVAERCLSCANCTLVCPTCFCSHVEDVTDLTGEHAERWRQWSSCFHIDFSYIHGGSIRSSVQSRYRQWLTHKLATWIDQFGTSGCVGCGRCITWCPVGIDITEEAEAIRSTTQLPELEGEHARS